MEQVSMYPIERNEIYLAVLSGMDIQPPDPVTRIEHYLQDIIDGNASTLPPVARVESYLAQISGADVPVPDPITRIELYLAKIAGMEVETPEPVTRLEYWLQMWAEAGPSAVIETVTGTLPLTMQNALSHAIVSLTRYGLCTQDGTPTPDAPVDIVCNNGALKLSPNLLDPSTSNIIIGESVSVQGPPATAANNWRTDYIPVVGGKTYIFYGRRKADNIIAAYCRMNFYAADKTFISPRPSYEQNTPTVATAPSNAAYVRLSSAPYNSQNHVTRDTFDAFNWIFAAAAQEIPYVPYGVVYAGGTHPGQNLVDLTAVTDDYYYDPIGVYTAISNARLTDYIPVRAGQKYTVYAKAATSGTAANVRCNLFDSAKVWKSQSSFTVTSGSENVSTVTPAEDGFLRVSANYTGTGAKVDWSTLQIVRGEYTLATMPPYEAYTEVPYQPEVLKVCGGNLFDASSYTEINAYVNANTGVLTAGSPGNMTQYCAVIPCKPSTQYNITGQGTSAWGAFTADSIGTTATAFGKGGILTTGANDRYLIGLVRANGDSIDYRNTLAVRETQTVSVPMLLSVGNSKDAAELIHGIKTRKVGVKVLNGTENWTNLSNYYNLSKTDLNTNSTVLPQNSTSIICTHLVAKSGLFTDGIGVGASYVNFKYDTIAATLDAWKAWLAAQYANGKPVIVLYPLATATTEQGTAQHLATHQGTNIVDSTANVGPVEAKVEYMASQANAAPLLGMMGPTGPEEPEEPEDEPADDPAEEEATEEEATSEEPETPEEAPAEEVTDEEPPEETPEESPEE